MSSNMSSIIIASLTACTFGMFLSSGNNSLSNELKGLSEKFVFRISVNLFRSLFFANIFLGAFISSSLAFIFQSFTKRSVFLICNIFYLLGGAIICLALNQYTAFLGRIIIGFGVGLTCYNLPAYIFTLSTDSNRGFVMSFTSIGIVTGLFFGSLMGTLIENYQVVHMVILSFIIAHCFLLYFIRNVYIEVSNKDESSLMDLLRKPGSFKSLFITAAFHFGQHASGIDYFSTCMDKILEKSERPKLYTNASFAFSLITCIASGFFTDKVGRKPLMIISASIIGIATIFLCMDSKHLTVVLLYLFGYNIGLASIPWFISNEIFPTNFSAPGSVFCVGINWLSAFIFTLSLFPLHEKFGNIMFLSYTVSMSTLILITLFLFKETKNRKVGFQ